MDGASNMIAAVEMFSERRNKNCFNVDIANLVWIHCNAHLIPAFDSGVEKILVSIEEKAKMEKSVLKDFNKTFFKVSDSITFTMLRAIFNMIGSSKKIMLGDVL